MKKLAALALVALCACSRSEPSKTEVAPAFPAATGPSASAPAASSNDPGSAPSSPSLSEKDKALANPYPNDLGPDRLPEAVLAAYPADVRKGYDALVVKCAQCHSPARPLNSRFVELAGNEAAALRKSDPGLFADPAVRQIEASIWNRYVKRMMNKPGCAIVPAEGKAIWTCLAHDSRARKLGAGARAWEEHRKKLLADFKARHPQRYAELSKASDL